LPATDPEPSSKFFQQAIVFIAAVIEYDGDGGIVSGDF
jgi:hypothetical protein